MQEIMYGPEITSLIFTGLGFLIDLIASLIWGEFDLARCNNYAKDLQYYISTCFKTNKLNLHIIT